MDKDFFIAGQGLAGTLLSWFLRRQGARVDVADDGHRTASSTVAAGILNPVTGRYFVKSWRYEALWPVAVETYRALEAELGVPILHPMPVLRALATPGDENAWAAKLSDPALLPFVGSDPTLGAFSPCVQPPYAWIELLRGGRADLPLLLQSWRQVLRQSDSLLEEAVNYADLEIHPDRVGYRGKYYRRAIFCEGYRMHANPWFAHLPLRGNKGEVLILEIEGPPLEKMFKHQIFLVPLGHNRYWAGATDANRFDSDQPTPQGRAWLMERLEQILRVPFRVLEHRAAVRPGVADRRPLLGVHPDFPSLAVFNGLGSKGSSLGPFFARQLSNYLLRGGEIDPDVDIRRFV